MANYVRFERKDGTRGAGVIEKDTIRVIEEPFWESTRTTGDRIAMSAVRLLPPCEPRSIVCVGLNYASHLQGRPAPDPPTLFFKPLSSIAGPDDPIVLPKDAGRVDPEGEIVIVIGKRVSKATREEALEAIFGYTCGNDVSARVWQRGDGQWWRAKGSDTFGVFGPDIVTGLDYDKVELWARVNGEEVQHGKSDELILDIPEIVRYVSAAMTLEPGDAIFTGTPGSPPEIHAGDVVEVEISGSMVLRNPVVAQE
jgi:2-keto-4-pentenoate hydratase/2-oxohepta-3-ene-1,7-dioic acid hydratase in catechol pathway